MLMFGIKEWRQTKFYQEVEQETKLEIALRLLKMGLGLSVESLGNATISDVVKGVVKLAIRSAGIPIP